MSKSLKRNKYYDDHEEEHDMYLETRKQKREKRIQSALKSKNIDRLLELDEEFEF